MNRRSVTPDSRSRLPYISMPTSGAHAGTTSEASTAVAMGNTITAACDTGLACGMSIQRSCSVVSSRITGGWMIGTSAM